jgi:hypothetical protein
MNEHNRQESGKLERAAKWVIRQLLLEVESRGTEIELYDAQEGGYIVFYRLISGSDATVEEYAGKLSINKNGQQLEVQNG